MIGDAALCRAISMDLLEQYGFYIQPINYPTVAKGSERLRITPGPFHDDQMIDDLVTALSNVVITRKASDVLSIRHRAS